MSLWSLLVLLLSSSQLGRVAALSLTISPDHIRTSRPPESVTYTCTADVALIGCQFRWWESNEEESPLLEPSRTTESRADYSHLNSKLTGYNYSGRGLGAGDCGVTLQVKGFNSWVVACRVRAETGGWTYAWASLYAADWQHLPHTLTPRESVVLPGGEARFAFKTQETLRRCRFSPPDLTVYFDNGAESRDSAGRHLYLGAGLAAGECGLALTNVSERDNGPVGGYIRNKADTKDEYRFTVLIVARPPDPPALSVVYTDAGVTATCAVHEARPVANMSWVLGDDVIRQDSLDDHPGNDQVEWRWPWMKGSITQTLTLRLRAQDNGKVLKCVVFHVALDGPLEATEIISFNGRSATVHPNESLGTTTDPTCTATSMLDLLFCQGYRVRASQLGNTSCISDEVPEIRVREVSAAARTAELVEEQARITLEHAKFGLEAVKSQVKADSENKAALAKVALEAAMSEARAAEARARHDEARAKITEEQLQSARERRSQSPQQPRSPLSEQG